MSIADEVALILEQEARLVLPAFDETIAFTIGAALSEVRHAPSTRSFWQAGVTSWPGLP